MTYIRKIIQPAHAAATGIGYCTSVVSVKILSYSNVGEDNNV